MRFKTRSIKHYVCWTSETIILSLIWQVYKALLTGGQGRLYYFVVFDRSIKHYFLLDKGDFIVQFMDMTEDEMRQDMENITPTRLETLLELALRTSTANTDQFKDDLRSEPIQQIRHNVARRAISWCNEK